jgi:hypothetical protein
MDLASTCIKANGFLNFNSRRNRQCYQQIVTFKTCFGFVKIMYKNVEVRNTTLNESIFISQFFRDMYTHFTLKVFFI